MLVGCLHSAASNVAGFEAASVGIVGLDLRHVVRPDLLAAALASGGMTAETCAAAEIALRQLAAACDAVLLTCSSLGEAVEGVQDAAVPVLRVDAALAERAVRDGGKVIAFYAAPSSAESTKQLFAKAAAKTGAMVEARKVPGAWAHFTNGDYARYFALVAAATETAYSDGAKIVALTQVSMAGAAELVRGGPEPLTSPAIALQAVVALLEARAGVPA